MNDERLTMNDERFMVGCRALMAKVAKEHN
jgi:hypothetical protein